MWLRLCGSTPTVGSSQSRTSGRFAIARAHPVQERIDLALDDRLGLLAAEIAHEIRNPLDRPVTGQAVPSYSPELAAQYFKKLECFCFRQQTLGPGEVRRMPVVFVVDPALPAEVREITLSYTFFEVAGTKGASG